MNYVRGSIVVSIPACHAGNRGSIPRRGVIIFFLFFCATGEGECNGCKNEISFCF